ncbi:hypothetical protein LSH36_309g01031 [Paralvinella palmiformis]|uniref:Uncharacterized protein n=1 Tax=Paralvinella palmiformis TaxID=53620 RepID=A0AAD9JHG2_9ANNE|nr:hypothetical protein LSH36_309g01031 [Paralvinella palmiformis]
MMLMGYCLVFCTAIVYQSSGAPNRKRPEMGPCAGMDCLHGILMHGDSEIGEDHKNEDLYNRLEKEDAERKEKKPVGPCSGKDCMELINHGMEDPETAHKMAQKIGPEQKDTATVDLTKALHGGERVDHNTPKKSVGKNDETPPTITDPESILHGDEAVKHGGIINQTEGSGKQSASGTGTNEGLENQGDPENRTDSRGDNELGVEDLEAVLHGGEHVHHGSSTSQQIAGDGQVANTASTDGGLDSQSGSKAELIKPGPSENNEAEKSEHHERHTEQGRSHHTLHDVRERHPQRHHRQHAGTLDPHGLIHGEHKIDAGGPSKEELADYNRWKKSREEIDVRDDHRDDDEEDEDGDGAAFGFSLPYISDTIMNEIELLKQRYLPRFWSDEDETEDDPDEVRVEDEDAESDSNDRNVASSGRERNEDRRDGKSKGSVKAITEVKHLPRQSDKESKTRSRLRSRVEI